MRFIFPRLISKVVFLVLALLMVACASTSITPPSSPTLAQNTSSSEQIENVPPIEQAAAPGSVAVHVTLVEFRIISSLMVFHAGTAYYFVVTNRGHEIHEFMIMPDKADGTPLPPSAQYKGMLIELEPILPGTTWAINYKFSPSAVGRYEIACQMRNHYKAGMRLPIVVSPAST